MPSERRDYYRATGTVYLGGTAVGLTPNPLGPHVVVEGLQPNAVAQMTRVVCVRFPPDGRPEEVGRWDGALVIPVSTGDWTTALASCPAPTGGTAVLVRELQPPACTLATAHYAIREVTVSATAAGLSADIPVSSGAVLDSHAPPSVRVIPDGTGYCVVSADADRVRVAVVPRQGPPAVAPDVRLGGPGTALPGLDWIDVASVRADGTWLSVAFTAYLNHPGIGPASVAPCSGSAAAGLGTRPLATAGCG